MIQSVVVAFGSDTDADAIVELIARSLARLGPVVDLVAVARARDEEATLTSRLAEVETRLVDSGVRVTSSVSVGDLAQVAVLRASSSASLLVLFRDSSPELSTASASVPLLLIPPLHPRLELRKVVVILGDNPESANSIPLVRGLCRGSACAMVLVHVGAKGARPKHIEKALLGLELAGFYTLLRRPIGTGQLGALHEELEGADLVATSRAKLEELGPLLSGRALLLPKLPAKATSLARL